MAAVLDALARLPLLIISIPFEVAPRIKTECDPGDRDRLYEYVSGTAGSRRSSRSR